MKCPICNKEIDETKYNFCPSCGWSVKRIVNNNNDSLNNKNNNPFDSNDYEDDITEDVNDFDAKEYKFDDDFDQYNKVVEHNVREYKSYDNNKHNNKIGTTLIWAVIIFTGTIVLLLAISLATGYVEIEIDDEEESAKNEVTTVEAKKSVDNSPSVETTTEKAVTNSGIPVVGNTNNNVQTKPKYEIFFDDISWSEAAQRCMSKGGHLATFDTQEEFNYAVSMASQYSSKSVFYVGGARPSGGSYYYWVGSDGLTYGNPINDLPYWLSGEPSFYDADTGNEEICVVLFYHSKTGRYCLNDEVDNYLSVVNYKYGKLAYICEYD